MSVVQRRYRFRKFFKNERAREAAAQFEVGPISIRRISLWPQQSAARLSRYNNACDQNEPDNRLALLFHPPVRKGELGGESRRPRSRKWRHGALVPQNRHFQAAKVYPDHNLRDVYEQVQRKTERGIRRTAPRYQRKSTNVENKNDRTRRECYFGEAAFRNWRKSVLRADLLQRNVVRCARIH